MAYREEYALLWQAWQWLFQVMQPHLGLAAGYGAAVSLFRKEPRLDCC